MRLALHKTFLFGQSYKVKLEGFSFFKIRMENVTIK